jgi:hypothetical protein
MMKKAISSVACLGLASTLAIATVTTPASAAQAAAATVQVVQYAQGTLLLQVSGVYYYAQTAPGTGCTQYVKNIDTLKAWESLSTSALLSGKQVVIQYTACNGYNFIDLINLYQ